MPTDLQVTIDDGATSVVPGTDDTYTITVTNNGPDTVSSVTLTDPLPAGALNASFAPSAGAYDVATGVWSGLNLASGDSAIMTLSVAINPSATGSLTNTVTVAPPAGVTDTNAANDSATDTDTLTPQADLAITKTDGTTTVVPGTSDTYTIVVSNTGPSTAVAAPVTDMFPAAITSVSWTAVASAGSSVAAANGTGNIATTVTLLPGGTATFTAAGQISPSATGTLVNTATVDPPAGTTDPNPANNAATDTDTIPVADAPTIHIVKFVNGDDADSPTGPQVVPGSTLTFTYVVTNTGNVPLANVVVTDDKLGPITTFTGDTNGNGLLDLTETWTYVSTATALAGQQTNVGTVTGQDVNTSTTVTDNNPANYFGGDSPAIHIVKFVNGQDADSPTGPQVVPGSTLTFTYVVTNTGNVPLANVVVTDDKLGPITTFTGDTNGNGLLDLTETWTYVSTATALAGQQTNVGTVTGEDANNPGTTVTAANPANYFGGTLTPQADLRVTLTDGVTTVVPGTSDTYTITVSNNGPDTVSSLTLTDTVPAALLNATFGSPSAGSYNPGSGLWSGLSLASGQSVFITLNGVIGIATGTLSNTVTVAPPAGTTDTDPANNTATDTNTLTLFITPNPSPPPATSANMITRHDDGLYAIYDIGNNATLAAHPLAEVGTDWQFAGFNGSDPSDMILRNSTSGAFQVYDVGNNNITGTAALGAVGLNWQVAGFGNFSSGGETDMMLRDANTGGFQAYDIANNQITGAAFVGTVGLDWEVGGFGNFSSRGTSDMILRNTITGGLQVYDIDHNQITGTAFMGTVGLDWQASGVGNFSSIPGESDMILRNINTGGLQVYDIANNQITGTAFLGTVGLDWQFAGVAPVHGPGASDLVLRNVNTGEFEVYDIANNQITGAASLGQVGLEWQVGGFAADPAPASMGGADSTSQLVQAMAGFGGGGAADGSSTPPPNADASQQTFLTQPHA